MTAGINNTMGTREWAKLIVLSVLWGGSFFFIGVAVNELPPLTIVFSRVLLAALALWCIALVMGERFPRCWRVWAAFLGMGLLNNVLPFTLIVWGQTQIASGLASILNATTPIFTVIVAGRLLPDERITPLKTLGVVIGFIGVGVMIGIPALGDTGNAWAQIAILVAALSYAFAGVFGRRFKAMGVSPMVTAAGQVTTSALVMLPLTYLIEGPFPFNNVSAGTWAALIGLAVISTAIAYVLYFSLLASAGATNLLLVTLLIPVSAVLLGWLFLSESLQWIHITGMGLIAIGLSAIDGRLWRKVRVVGSEA